MRAILTIVSLLIFLPGHASAAPMDDEIDRLIREVGRNGCSFIRNGERYSSRDARAWLRSKYRRNAHLVDSTEAFITKIASQSSTTGEPYRIRCRGKAEAAAGDWFTAWLAQHRAAQESPPSRP